MRRTSEIFFILCISILVAMEILVRGENRTTAWENIQQVAAYVADERYNNQTSSEDIRGSEKEDLESWTPPQELTKELPVYIAGYDYEKRPVVVCEIGRWDFRKWLERDQKSRDTMYKFARKYWHTLKTLKSPYEDAEDGVVYIMDGQDFNLRHIASTESIKFQLYSAREADRIESYLAETILINVNFVIQSWLDIIRPVAGRWVGRIETFGNNQAKLMAALTRKIPRDQLPPWYGGSSKEYKPVKLF